MDVATKWMECHSAQAKDTPAVKQGLKEFAGRQKVKQFYSDGAGELKVAAHELGWLAATPTP